MSGCHCPVTRTHRPAQICWTSQIREIQEISSNDGHLQPPSYPQINCTNHCLDTSYLTNNVLEHWFHSCGHLGSFKRLEFLLKWVKWHSRWFPGFCAVSVCQPLLSLCDWYLDMGIFHQTYYSDHSQVSCLLLNMQPPASPVCCVLVVGRAVFVDACQSKMSEWDRPG